MMITTLLLLLFVSPSHSFQCQQRSKFLIPKLKHQISAASTHATNLRAQEQEDDVEFGEKYEGEIDWDGEWKKVMRNQDQPKVRPGNNFYKNDAEKTIIKATRSAQEKIIEVQQNIPRLDGLDFRSLQGNTAFWLAVLAIISVGSALIAASGQSSITYTDQSFYI